MLCMILAGCAGGTLLPAALKSRLRQFWFASIYYSRRLRGKNSFTGGSLVTFASILVRLQVKRAGGGFVLAPFNKFMLCLILAGCADGIVLPAAL